MTQRRHPDRFSSTSPDAGLALVADCGHHYTPRGGATGYAIDSTEATRCYPCTDTETREQMRRGNTVTGYLDGHARTVTTWTGRWLATVTDLRRHRGIIPSGGCFERVYVRARDEHQVIWWGTGPGEGMYVRLHRTRTVRRQTGT